MFEWLMNGGGKKVYDDTIYLDSLDGEELASLLGLTTGVAINPGIDWITMTVDGKEIMFPRKPIRIGISWLDIYLAGAVYGTDDDGPYPYTATTKLQNKRAVIGGKTYRVRLMRGADVMLTSATYNRNEPVGTRNSEYHKTIIELYRNGGYTEDDLGIKYNNINSSMWCMESHTWNGGRGRVMRSRTNVLDFGASAGDIRSATTAGYTVWRPVLELEP